MFGTWNLRLMPAEKIASGRPSGDVLAVEEDLARGRLELAGDHGDQRGLAGAVGTEQDAQLVLFDAEIEIVQNRVAGNGRRQSL